MPLLLLEACPTDRQSGKNLDQHMVAAKAGSRRLQRYPGGGAPELKSGLRLIIEHTEFAAGTPITAVSTVPTFGPRMVCTHCGIVGADARPHWGEQPPRERLTGVQWR